MPPEDEHPQHPSQDPKPYAGKHITVTYETRRCLHAAECVGGLPEVFDSGQRPWVRPDGAEPERVAEVVRRPFGSAPVPARRRAGRGTGPADECRTVTGRPVGPARRTERDQAGRHGPAGDQGDALRLWGER
ncbi:hypothetical protein GCM10010347_34680 [Streptomyces cirratus]|uniref:Divergent 4Fe-4S mono-cluster domain-containing protein n=1 Tax=Streptomyces cirratus TaxID=68187 RepID=A0ABQ3ETV9_9ACTN|nr:hypothetical protein GCM10010347_34680 [Streptomyces cirratus]